MESDQELALALKPGAALRLKIDAGARPVFHQLLGLPDGLGLCWKRNGDGYRSVPVGTYTLKIASSAERRKMFGLGRASAECVQTGDHAGLEIHVSVTGDEAIIDLGTIRLLSVLP